MMLEDQDGPAERANMVQERRPCQRSLDGSHERTEIGTLLHAPCMTTLHESVPTCSFPPTLINYNPLVYVSFPCLPNTLLASSASLFWG